MTLPLAKTMSFHFMEPPLKCEIQRFESCKMVGGSSSPMSSLVDKLHPSRFSEMSPFMAAIVAFVLDEA